MFNRNNGFSPYLIKGTSFDDPVIQVFLQWTAKENVFTNCSREDPWLLRGIGQAAIDLKRALQRVQFPHKTLQQGRLKDHVCNSAMFKYIPYLPLNIIVNQVLVSSQFR